MTVDDFQDASVEVQKEGASGVVWDCNVCRSLVLDRQSHIDWHDYTATG